MDRLTHVSRLPSACGRCMGGMLDVLMQTLGSEADNLSFLLLMTNTIISGYRDASAPSSAIAAKRLRLVVRLGCSCHSSSP